MSGVDLDLFEDSQDLSDYEDGLSEPTSPEGPELGVQQNQPDVDLANQVPRWYAELDTEEDQGESESLTPHRQKRRKRSHVLESDSSAESETSEQPRKKNRSDNEELKSLVRSLYKKVSQNERMLKNILRRYALLN